MDEGSIFFAFTNKQGVGGSGGTARLGYLLVGRIKVDRGIIHLLPPGTTTPGFHSFGRLLGTGTPREQDEGLRTAYLYYAVTLCHSVFCCGMHSCTHVTRIPPQKFGHVSRMCVNRIDKFDTTKASRPTSPNPMALVSQSPLCVKRIPRWSKPKSRLLRDDQVGRTPHTHIHTLALLTEQARLLVEVAA
jgi:hypothetical protein